MQGGREVWIGEAQGVVEGRETIAYDTASMDSWHYSIKTHWTSKNNELILMYANLKLSLVRSRESQDGIQNVTKPANYITNI